MAPNPGTGTSMSLKRSVLTMFAVRYAVSLLFSHFIARLCCCSYTYGPDHKPRYPRRRHHKSATIHMILRRSVSQGRVVGERADGLLWRRSLWRTKPHAAAANLIGSDHRQKDLKLSVAGSYGLRLAI